MKRKVILFIITISALSMMRGMDWPSKEEVEEAVAKAAQEKTPDLWIQKLQQMEREKQIKELKIPGTYFSALPQELLPEIAKLKKSAERREAQQKLMDAINAGTLDPETLSYEQRYILISSIIRTSSNIEEFKKLVSVFQDRIYGYFGDILALLNRLLTENPSNNIKFISYLLENFGSSIVDIQSDVWNVDTQEYEGEITAKIEKLSKTDSNFAPILAKIKSFGED